MKQLSGGKKLNRVNQFIPEILSLTGGLLGDNSPWELLFVYILQAEALTALCFVLALNNIFK